MTAVVGARGETEFRAVTDRYPPEDRVVEFPVMRSFHVEGKIIRRWTDYFDLKQCLEQMPAGSDLPV